MMTELLQGATMQTNKFYLLPLLGLAIAFNLYAQTPVDFSILPFKEIAFGKSQELDLSKTQVFIFMSSRCPCSQGHFEHMNGLAKKFKQFQFWGIHSDKEASQLLKKKYFQLHPYSFSIFDDKNLKWANYFKAQKTPHAFVVSPQGEILYHGGVTNSRDVNKATTFYLDEVLTHLSENKSVPYTYGKAIGCFISR